MESGYEYKQVEAQLTVMIPTNIDYESLRRSPNQMLEQVEVSPLISVHNMGDTSKASDPPPVAFEEPASSGVNLKRNKFTQMNVLRHLSCKMHIRTDNEFKCSSFKAD